MTHFENGIIAGQTFTARSMLLSFKRATTVVMRISEVAVFVEIYLLKFGLSFCRSLFMNLDQVFSYSFKSLSEQI